jgi:ubiquitin C-terminal hydrolase
MKRPLKEQNNYGIPDEKAAAMAWEDYTDSNKSVIVKLFAGQQRSCLRCAVCCKESVTFEPFFNLSLPIPPSNSQCSIMVNCFFVLLGSFSSYSIQRYIHYRSAFSSIRNQNRSAGGLAHFVRIRKEPAKLSTSGKCLPF